MGDDNMPEDVCNWTTRDVGKWLTDKGFNDYVKIFCVKHKIDGRALILLNESDLRSPLLNIQVLGDLKRIMIAINALKKKHHKCLASMRYSVGDIATHLSHSNTARTHKKQRFFSTSDSSAETDFSGDEFTHSESSSKQHQMHSELKPELWKTVIGLIYFFIVTWVTAIVMVEVHNRVPDRQTYPPLPDIFLDNVPLIPWAFTMCELTGIVLFFIWVVILFFHKHRFILIRRMCALFGSVFLLRCFTMIITSLSVPGKHLDCKARVHNTWSEKVYAAILIWVGGGMTLQGVRTCGDYMFSGHTVALTLLNFFITEYTPRKIYYLHTFTWVLNLFGIFFILAGHEHYSIDVFIAFYISTRLFLYYHTLANNCALTQSDRRRTRIWFPLFSFFESGVDGIVPNEYECPVVISRRLRGITKRFFYVK